MVAARSRLRSPGKVILIPFEDGDPCDEWLEIVIVGWLQVRAATPNRPKNIWSRQEHGVPVAGLPDLRKDPIWSSARALCIRSRDQHLGNGIRHIILICLNRPRK